MNEIYIPALSKGQAVNLLESKRCLAFGAGEHRHSRVTQDPSIQVIWFTCIYIYIYGIYMYTRNIRFPCFQRFDITEGTRAEVTFGDILEIPFLVRSVPGCASQLLRG